MWHNKCGEKLIFHAGIELPEDDPFEVARNVVDEAQRKANDIARLAVVSPPLEAALDKLRNCDGSTDAVQQLLSFIHNALYEKNGATQCRELELLSDAVRALRNFNNNNNNNHDDNDNDDDAQYKGVESAVRRLWAPLCLAHFDDMRGYIAVKSNCAAEEASAKLHACGRMAMAFEAKALNCSDADQYRDTFKLASMARTDLTTGTFVSFSIRSLFISFIIRNTKGESTDFDSSCRLSYRCARCDAVGRAGTHIHFRDERAWHWSGRLSERR
jgi:hypothetical protein